MKLVFCSNYSGQTGTTTNLALVVSYLALHQLVKIFLMQIKCTRDSLEAVFLGNQEELMFKENGIDSLVSMMKSKPISKEMIDSCSVNLYRNRLYLLPNTMQVNTSMYDTTIHPMLRYCMNAIQQYYDVLFVDLGNVTNPSDFVITEQADIVVWNLCQNKHVFQECFEQNKVKGKKQFYIIGNYDSNSKYNLHYIQHNYKISSKQIGVIPYNTMIRDSYSESTLLKLLLQIDRSTKDECNYFFMKELSNTVEKLTQYMKC